MVILYAVQHPNWEQHLPVNLSIQILMTLFRGGVAELPNLVMNASMSMYRCVTLSAS